MSRTLTDTSVVTAQASDHVTHPLGLRWSKTSTGPIWSCDADYALRFREKVDGIHSRERVVFNAEASPWSEIANKLIAIWMLGFGALVELILSILLPLLDYLFICRR